MASKRVKADVVVFLAGKLQVAQQEEEGSSVGNILLNVRTRHHHLGPCIDVRLSNIRDAFILHW